MRTKTNYAERPDELEIFAGDESKSIIVFRLNIEEAATEESEGEPATAYTADEYRLTVPATANLEERVRAHMNEWRDRAVAEDYAKAATQIRAKRDKLLAESDARMCLDRMGLETPKGSTFTAWLSFLKGMGNVLSGSWAAYRKALRDLPEQPGFPYDVEFPKPPEE